MDVLLLLHIIFNISITTILPQNNVIRLKIQLNNCRFDFKIKQGKLKRLQETTNHF